ncbi:MAG: hypothetical protein M4579_007344 [Chaenotheca gracillima]|nr:MAG: hypothetical protein M4579_007344 [Chaenotheca gracillima]
MLRRVPAIPDCHRGAHTPLATITTPKACYLRAHSTWRVAEETSCGVDGKTKTRATALQLGIAAPTSLALTGTDFCNWVGTDDEKSNAANYIAILALGWSYVFSARLIEMQGQEGAEVVYTEPTTYKDGLDKDDTGTAISVDIGAVDDETARWWAALVAPGQGWKAVISRNDGAAFLSPWSVSIENNYHIFAKRDTGQPRSKLPERKYSPPSSKKAMELLIDFGVLHNLGSQFFAALNATLTFPTHNHYGTAAKLPSPTPGEVPQSPSSPNAIITNLLHVYEEIPYYMSISCNHSVLISSLCGVFWEPCVPCNLVSPWLHPVLNELPNSDYLETVAIICAIRCPRLGALWLGATLSGLAKTVLEFVASGTPPLDPDACAWTGCLQSFMDTAGSGPYCQSPSSETAPRIQRADVWRLLYLPPAVEDDLRYESPPFSPWKPVGTASVEHSVARIKIHLCCSRHQLEYRQWTWHLRDHSILEDDGLKSVADRNSPFCEVSTEGPILNFTTAPLDDHASRAASYEVFRWVTANGEGHPPNEEIYKDGWLCENGTDEHWSSQHKCVASGSHDGLSTLSEVSSTCNGKVVDSTDCTEHIKSKASIATIQDWVDENT